MNNEYDVYIRASNSSLCKEIDIICFFEESGTRRRLSIVTGCSVDDNTYDDLFNAVINKIRERGVDYKNNDSEFKDFLKRLAAEHQGESIFTIDPEENQDEFHTLSEFLLMI